MIASNGDAHRADDNAAEWARARELLGRVRERADELGLCLLELRIATPTGRWVAALRENGIPRSTAHRLVERGARLRGLSAPERAKIGLPSAPPPLKGAVVQAAGCPLPKVRAGAETAQLDNDARDVIRQRRDALRPAINALRDAMAAVDRIRAKIGQETHEPIPVLEVKYPTLGVAEAFHTLRERRQALASAETVFLETFAAARGWSEEYIRALGKRVQELANQAATSGRAFDLRRKPQRA